LVIGLIDEIMAEKYANKGQNLNKQVQPLPCVAPQGVSNEPGLKKEKKSALSYPLQKNGA